jgi:putative PEP-CTERM system TPR-repeat lipoprotein
VLAARGLAHLHLKQTEEARVAFEKALTVKPGAPDALLGRARILAGERKLEASLAEVVLALQGDATHADALMMQGDLLRAIGRNDEATAAYEKLVKAHPEHLGGLFALVSMAVASSKFEEAGAHLATIRKAAPGNPMAAYFQALIAFRKSEFKAARDAIGAVLKVAPNHLPSVLLGGAVDFALGSQELAQTRLKFVLDRVPGNLYARRLLVASYARAGQTLKALETLEPVLKQGTKDAAILALAGEVHMQLNQFDKAREFFQQATTLDPKNARMRAGLGLSQLAAGEVDAATAELESAAQLDATRHHADVLLISSYLQRGQYDEALKAARSLVSKQPDNPMSHNLLAAGHIGKRDDAAAREALTKALAIQPTYVPAAMNLAQLDLAKGDKKAARGRLESILAKDKQNMQAYMALATLGAKIDASQDEVRGWLERARKENPESMQPLIMLARMHMEAREPNRALELVDKALVTAPENAEVMDLAGQVQLAAGEKNRALSTFSRWDNAQPSATSAYRMATAQLANEDANGAISSLKRALAFRGQFPEAQILLAETEAALGRISDALKTAATLQQQNPRSPVGWLAEGDIHMRDKKYGRAVTAYEKAQTLGQSGALAIRLHAALASDGRAGDGEARIREWLKRQPADVPVRLYLAEQYLRAKKYKSAIAEYEVLSKYSPDNVVVLNNLAWSYLQEKDKRALETAERALKLQPESAAVLDTLGWILVQTGATERGVELLKRAADKAPKSPEIRYHYAQALEKSGERVKAKEELERLLVQFANFTERESATRLLASLR